LNIRSIYALMLVQQAAGQREPDRKPARWHEPAGQIFFGRKCDENKQ
jgi:hypothetical protein